MTPDAPEKQATLNRASLRKIFRVLTTASIPVCVSKLPEQVTP